ncbi:MAG: hypothetical protein JWN45_2148 [Acidobacteriaceae bacterium]|nr:hypothetical protein [Acidobacteriaceae bacterium]
MEREVKRGTFSPLAGVGEPNRGSQLPSEAKVFDFLVKIDDGLRKKVSSERFNRDLNRRYREFDSEAIFPDDVTLGLLYERLLDANVERTWVILAKRLSRSHGWRNHRRWVDQAAELANRLSILLRAGNRGFLPASYYKKARSLSVSIRRLTGKLRDLQRFDRRLDEIAETHNWNSSLRNARIKMDRLLIGKCPSLTKEQRAELITTATELVGLKKEETVEAVTRSINRSILAEKSFSKKNYSRK